MDEVKEHFQKFLRYGQCDSCVNYYLNMEPDSEEKAILDLDQLECSIGEKCWKKEPCKLYREKEVK